MPEAPPPSPAASAGAAPSPGQPSIEQLADRVYRLMLDEVRRELARTGRHAAFGRGA